MILGGIVERGREGSGKMSADSTGVGRNIAVSSICNILIFILKGNMPFIVFCIYV